MATKCGCPRCPGYGNGPVGQAHPCVDCGKPLHGICGTAPDPENPMQRRCYGCSPTNQPAAAALGAPPGTDPEATPAPVFGFFRSPLAQDAGLPTAAQHERPRKQKAPAPPKPAGKSPAAPKKAKASGSRENAAKRLAALPAEERRLFQINSGDRTKLFCIVCRKPVNVETKSQTDQHISTPLHVKNKERYEREQAEGEARKSMVSEHFAGRLHAAGSSLTVDTHAARHEMVEIMMECAIPLDKLGTHPKLRRVLERGLSSTLGDVSDLRRNYVPLVEQTEQNRIRAELLEERISLTYDSSQRNGDATVVVANWCTAGFVLESRLLACTTFAKHMDHKQLQTFISKLLLTAFALEGDNILGGPRDAAAVNGAAATRLQNAFSRWYDLICLPHTLSLAGDRIALTTLNIFMTALSRQSEGSRPRALARNDGLRSEGVLLDALALEGGVRIRHLRQDRPPYRVCARAANRGSRRGAHQDVVRHRAKRPAAAFPRDGRAQGRGDSDRRGDVHARERQTRDPRRARQDLRAAGAPYRARDPARNSGLLTETDALLASFSAITVDQQVQRPVSSTQEVQHGVITRVGVSHVTIDWSGSRSVTRSGDHMETLPRADVKLLLEKHWASRRTELVSAALSGYAYLEDRVHGRCNTIYSLVPTMHFLDLVRVFDPSWVVANLSRLEDSAVKDLCLLPPFEEPDLTSRLLAQAPAYRAAVIAGCEIDRSDINQFTEGVLAWWRVHGNKFSAWAEAARIAFAFKPSSAQAERIFSMLKAMFTPQQASSLMDMVQGSLMMRYNGRGAV